MVLAWREELMCLSDAFEMSCSCANCVSLIAFTLLSACMLLACVVHRTAARCTYWKRVKLCV